MNFYLTSNLINYWRRRKIVETHPIRAVFFAVINVIYFPKEIYLLSRKEKPDDREGKYFKTQTVFSVFCTFYNIINNNK